MNVAPTTLPVEQFAPAARRVLTLLNDAFLRDGDLTNDLDAVLGAPAGPVGVAGAKRRQKREQGFLSRFSKPSRRTGVELGRELMRLDRMLGRIVEIAQVREWEPPYPNVEEAIQQAQNVRIEQRHPKGEFMADRAHLRRLAMAADDLLVLLLDDDAEASDDAAA
ncbi:hypothetical protein [Streptomyces anulatus]|uniref:hypothetical protein n=1 Tax=Streptomyces anulatus TaxID=1892 RepID=UPI00340F5610